MSSVGFLATRWARLLADGVVTSPLFAWTWSGTADETFLPRLAELRPADSQTVIEMMDGKYLLGGTLVDTGGVSPFSVPDLPETFFADLHGFGWLRHFQGLRDTGQRRFALTLVMDWIGRHGAFDRKVWTPQVTARRVLNWLKNFALLTESASPEQQQRINRVLARQLQSLRLREKLIDAPFDRLYATIALAAAALSSDPGENGLETALDALERQLARQIDADGLHLSRNPKIQIQILAELMSLRPDLVRQHPERGDRLAARIETMRAALARLILPTGEPGYFNGCGDMALEAVMAVAGAAGGRTTPVAAGIASGYGVLVQGQGKLIADSGLVPPLAYADKAHAGALSFEFACAGTLIVGNCGPAPGQLPESGALFRHSSAHSAPTIDDVSATTLGGPAALATRLRQRGPAPAISLSDAGDTLDITSHGYASRYGVTVNRRVSLLGDGHTLVGQDRLIAAAPPTRAGDLVIRFHLGPGAHAERIAGAELIRITFRSGESWAFLWEGATAVIEASVRNSLHFGLAHIDQIVLTAPALPEVEVAWVFTREDP